MLELYYVITIKNNRVFICAHINLYYYLSLPVVPARGGAEVALGMYKTFLIYRTCMRRAPAKPVRACILRKWCPVSHVTFEAPLRASHFTLLTALFTLHTSHCTLRTPNFTLHTPHFTLPTSHVTLHSPHLTLLTSHCFLHTSHSTLHTALVTPTHHTALFISSELLSPYPSSSLLISSLLIVIEAFMNHFPVLLLRNLHAPCASQARACVLCAKLLQCCCQKNMTCARPRCNATSSKHFPHTCTSSQIISSELFSSHFMSSHMSAKFFLAIFMSTTSQ